MKYVINSQYGGFSISDVAIHRYAELKGITLYEDTRSKFGKLFKSYYTTPTFEDGSYFSCHDIPRNDPALIQVIEEMGSKAAGSHATLEIVEIEAGKRFRRQEYDGNEWIECEDEIEWETAV